MNRTEGHVSSFELFIRTTQSNYKHMSVSPRENVVYQGLLNCKGITERKKEVEGQLTQSYINTFVFIDGLELKSLL